MKQAHPFTPSWDLVGKSVELLRSHPYSAFWLVLIPAILTGTGSYLDPNSFTSSTDVWANNHQALASQIGIAVTMLGVLWTLLALPATIAFAVGVVRGEGDDLLSFIRKGFHYFWRLYGLFIVTGILIVVGIIALIVPGLIFLRRYMLAPYYLVSEDLGILESMRRSADQTPEQRRSVWGVIGVMFVISIAASVVSNIPFVGMLLGPLVSMTYFFGPPLRQLEISDSPTLADATFVPKPKKSKKS
jgi:uncharacterized membrane protein